MITLQEAKQKIKSFPDWSHPRVIVGNSDLGLIHTPGFSIPYDVRCCGKLFGYSDLSAAVYHYNAMCD